MYPSSQPAQEFSHHLPIAKYSYTSTSTGHNGPLNWNHIIDNGDLMLSMTGSCGRTMLNVSRDHDVLEQIDLTRLTREAANLTQSQKQAFAVIVKLPCLAVKYPSGTCLRRFQVKFASDCDYYTALATLSQINCPFSDSKSESTQMSRKLTSLSPWSNGPAGTPGRETYSQTGSSSFVFPLSSSAPSSSGTGPIVQRPSSSSSFTAPMYQEHTTPIPTQNQNQNQNQIIRQHQPLQPILNPPPAPPTTTTTPTAYHYDPEALEKLLPPKRLAPFAKNPITKPSEPVHVPVPQSQAQSSSQTNPQTPTPAPTPTDLATYLDTPTAERTAMLETLLCNLLGNDEFMRLCEDVEGIWARFAFGRRDR